MFGNLLVADKFENVPYVPAAPACFQPRTRDLVVCNLYAEALFCIFSHLFAFLLRPVPSLLRPFASFRVLLRSGTTAFGNFRKVVGVEWCVFCLFFFFFFRLMHPKVAVSQC